MKKSRKFEKLMAALMALVLLMSVFPVYEKAEAKTTIRPDGYGKYYWYMPSSSADYPKSGEFLLLCFGVYNKEYYQMKAMNRNINDIIFDQDHFFYKCSKSVKETIMAHMNNSMYATEGFITDNDMDAVYCQATGDGKFRISMKYEGGKEQTQSATGSESVYILGYGNSGGNIYGVCNKWKPQVVNYTTEWRITPASQNGKTKGLTRPARLLATLSGNSYYFSLKAEAPGDSSRARAWLLAEANNEACTRVLVGVPLNSNTIPSSRKVSYQNSDGSTDPLSNDCPAYTVKNGEVVQITKDTFLPSGRSIVVKKGGTLIVNKNARLFLDGNLVIAGTVIVENLGAICATNYTANCSYLKIFGGELIISTGGKVFVHSLFEYGGSIINYGAFVCSGGSMLVTDYDPFEKVAYNSRKTAFTIEARKASFTHCEASKVLGYPCLCAVNMVFNETTLKETYLTSFSMHTVLFNNTAERMAWGYDFDVDRIRGMSDGRDIVISPDVVMMFFHYPGFNRVDSPV